MKLQNLLGKEFTKLINPKSGRTLKKRVNICRLKIYHESQSTKQVAKHAPSKNRQRKNRINGL